MRNSTKRGRFNGAGQGRPLWMRWSGILLWMGILGAAAQQKSVDRLLNDGRSALREGRMTEAGKVLREAVQAAPDNANAHLLLGQWCLASGDSSNAVLALGTALRLNPELAPAYQWRGLEWFKLGQVEKAVADFDAYLKRVPGQEPHHWQRGIAYYYTGQYAEGRRQFELHQTVNPQDVENAVWHFLCVSRQSGIEEARSRLIPIAGDRRVPMAEVHALFKGSAGPEAVLNAARGEGGDKAAGREQERFYAHLYLGLYYEVKGQEGPAKEHIRNAAALSGPFGYMGAVARVHLSRRGWVSSEP